MPIIGTLSTLALALAGVVSAHPTAEPTALLKRDTCVFIGTHSVQTAIGSGGPGQAPVSNTYNGLHIEYQGGVNISPALGGRNVNAITSKHQTFASDETGLPEPITWYADFVLGYKSCTVEYEGGTYTGGSVDPGSFPAGTSAWQCNVDFPCEGNIV